MSVLTKFKVLTDFGHHTVERVADQDMAKTELVVGSTRTAGKIESKTTIDIRCRCSRVEGGTNGQNQSMQMPKSRRGTNEPKNDEHHLPKLWWLRRGQQQERLEQAVKSHHAK